VTKWIVAILLGLLGVFQYQWWTGEGNIREVLRLKKMIVVQNEELEKLSQRNHLLDAEIQFLKEQPLALEERARSELGMIKQGETFYLVVEPLR